MHSKRQKSLLKKHGLKGVNKPKMTPKHNTKKAIVLAKTGPHSLKLIRFGAQGMGHNYSAAARKSFKARHAKNIAKGKSSAAFWANKFLWSRGGKSRKPPKSQKRVLTWEDDYLVPLYEKLMERKKQDKDKAIIQNMEINCQKSIIKKNIEGKGNGYNIWKRL